jgi:hypothetical protein
MRLDRCLFYAVSVLGTNVIGRHALARVSGNTLMSSKKSASGTATWSSRRPPSSAYNGRNAATTPMSSKHNSGSTNRPAATNGIGCTTASGSAPDIIHWGVSAPGGEPVLFVYNSVETCFFPGEGGI